MARQLPRAISPSSFFLEDFLHVFLMAYANPIRKYPGDSSSPPRNRLIHGYLGIDNDTLWSIIPSDIPALLPQLIALRGKLP